jgi:FtsP/CotA-like multicopper oxidase with cupredoxin domain
MLQSIDQFMDEMISLDTYNPVSRLLPCARIRRERIAAIVRTGADSPSCGAWILALGLSLLVRPAIATDAPDELVQPPICSAKSATDPAVKPVCTVTALGSGSNEVKIDLVAQTSVVEVAGYKLTTENYNAAYVTPIVVAMPGDTVAAHIVNTLSPRTHDGTVHGDADQNPTNLHYFHGGIVSPNNAPPKPVELGTGDNVYVHLVAGPKPPDVVSSFDLAVPIPGKQKLDARVLESTGYISHPVGLNWYHSHMHGISSDQVMGGMSGLLSVGEPDANVKAACRTSPAGQVKCSDVDKDTAELRSRTKVRYVLLRDLPVKDIQGRPDQPDHTSAVWAPEARDFPDGTQCGAWDGTVLNKTDAKFRRGFCQRDMHSAWLFTLNGQRFPTVTVEGGTNTLLRIGNVSANIGYWLELYNESDGSVLPLTIVSLDGIVPAKPVSSVQAKQPIQAINLNDLLLMPASRVEIYVRNDEMPHAGRQVYVLRTKDLRGMGPDEWPEIQLARVVLEPNTVTSKAVMGLNALVATAPHVAALASQPAEIEALPEGCVRDLDAASHEFRRVTFLPGDPMPTGEPTWNILTEIPVPLVDPANPVLKDEGEYSPADPKTTIKAQNGLGVPFEDYMGADGRVDWSKSHVCIKIDHGVHAGSHKQLWVLSNSTATLHNFHIHQMKFRLATKLELEQTYHILPPGDDSQTCALASTGFPQPDYKCYDPSGPNVHDPGASPLWHDTIPLPPGSRVFVLMSFDAKEQLGRFVFHCHILKHEDKGLMAPIEVWQPTLSSTVQKSVTKGSSK